MIKEPESLAYTISPFVIKVDKVGIEPTHRSNSYFDYQITLLGHRDSNPECKDQNLDCYQLQHSPILIKNKKITGIICRVFKEFLE